MASQLRRFNFFDKETVKDPETDKPFEGFKLLQIKCSASGRGSLLFGDAEGFIHEVDRALQITSFQAYQFGVSHLYQLHSHNILVSVGSDEEGGINPLVKIWNLDKVDRGGAPQLVRTIKVSQGKSVPVSCIAVHEDLSQLAIGLTNGTVLLARGDIARDRFTNKPPRPIHEGKAPVTGLGFRQTSKDVVLFVVTAEEVVSYVTTNKDHREHLDSDGAELACSVISDIDSNLWVARSEALCAYVPEGRGAALGFEGEKKMLYCFRNYLVIVSKEGRRGESATMNKMNTITIYDAVNRFIAFQVGLSDITHLLSEWGSLFVLTGDGTLYQFAEKDFQTKLDMLFKKNMYDIAINLARTQHGEGEGNDSLIEIYSQYAEHLYTKGNYDAAIQQYIKTIGRLEPSHVIRKFLDSQRIFNLTDYLQALHEKEMADKHHTTLLLNCYTKLKNVSKLDEFIKTEKNLNFDLETAITVCRQAGYYTHALYLADKFEQHDWYLKIQLEDVKVYEDALAYIARLDFTEADRNLKAYGKELVNQLPEKTTKLLMLLCTGYVPAGKDALAGAAAMGELPCASPDEFIHIYVNQTASLRLFLEHMIRVKPDCPAQVYDTLLELLLRAEDLDKTDLRAVNLRENSIMELLQHGKYSEYHAMVLTQIYDFKPGILFLYERTKQYQQIVQYYMEKNHYADVIEACKKYGTIDRGLWVQALSYFAGKEEDCKAQISEVLTHIDKRNLLPPLMVIDALSRNSNATLAVIKDYITRRIDQENRNIAEDERLTRQYQEETERMRAEIHELKTQAKIFQDTKCTNCKAPLDLPAVHFLCGHSYHEQCLQNEYECTACSDDRRKVQDIVQSQSQSAEQHDQFFKQLDGAESRFSVVADYFGRGLFNKVTVVEDPVVDMRKVGGGAAGSSREINFNLDISGGLNLLDEFVDSPVRGPQRGQPQPQQRGPAQGASRARNGY